MEIEFGNKKLARQLGSASEIKRAFGTNSPRVSQRLDEMRSASNLAALQKIPAANCHLLKGNRSGQWSVNISPNFRMIFEPFSDPLPRTESGELDTTKVKVVKIIETVDYH